MVVLLVWQAAEFLQSAMRGHLNRRQQMKRMRSPSRDDTHHHGYQSEATESDLESATEYLQTAFRGHLNRKEINKRWEFVSFLTFICLCGPDLLMNKS